MAKQEIQEQEIKVEETTKEENIEYEDEEILTPENKANHKKLIKTEWWEIVTKMIKELSKTAEDEILKQAKAYSAVKSHGYTIYDIQGAWLDGLNKITESLDAISKEDEVKKAVEEVNTAEEQKIK